MTRPVPARWLVRALRPTSQPEDVPSSAAATVPNRPEVAVPVGAEAFLATLEEYEGRALEQFGAPFRTGPGPGADESLA